MKSRTLTALAAGAALAALSPLAAASAQDAGQSGMSAGAETASVEITDEEADQFVAAAQAVQEIALSYQERIEGAGDQAAAAQLAAEAQSAFRAAIEEEGMSVARYQEIVRAAQSDPELMETLNTRVQENQAEGGEAG